jgi:SSS family solute:Na+ symporter
MSTIDTHLNWGASYMINDFYQPFISRNKSPGHYVFVSRIVMILLTAIALVVTTKLTSIFGAYKYLGVVFGSIGTVMIMRWYWWRVNAYSEIAAIVTSLIVANYVQIKLPSRPGADFFAVRVVITVSAVALAWVTVTFLTSKRTPDEHTAAFYSKMRVGGPGWRKVREFTGVEPGKGEFTRNLMAWLCCVVFLFSLTLGFGKFIFHEWRWGLVCILVAGASGLAVKKLVSGMKFL